MSNTKVENKDNLSKVLCSKPLSTKSGKVVMVAKKRVSNRSFAKSGVISDNDAEMDYRAKAAVNAAVKKAKICNKPIAVYDINSKKVYMEYADGSRRIVQ